MQSENWDQEIKPLLTAFGKFIKTKRNELGLSQEELATRSGLHRTYISDVERGIRNLTIGAAWFLSKGLGMELAELLANVPITHTDAEKELSGAPILSASSGLLDASAAR